MAKDPAFLFYTQDFLTGTMFMNNEQVGIYIRLLCAQHQHGGMINKISFNSMVGQNDIVRAKFIEVEEGFYNERMMSEIGKRSKKSSNLSANAKQRWEKVKLLNSNSNAIASNQHMPTEDENENTVLQLNKEEPDIQQPDPHLIFNLEKVKQNFDNDYKLHEMAQRENFFSSEEMDQAVTEFWNTKQLDPETVIKPYSDFQKHFLNWCRQNKVRIKRKEKLQPNGEVKSEFKRIVRSN